MDRRRRHIAVLSFRRRCPAFVARQISKTLRVVLHYDGYLQKVSLHHERPTWKRWRVVVIRPTADVERVQGWGLAGLGAGVMLSRVR